MKECSKELCPRCAIREWCSHRLDQKSNQSMLINRMIDTANPNFIVR